jgi:two-component system, chemotaxis family, CheB/CheR fusion protein
MSEPDPALEELLHYLRDTRGFDFTGYKRASLGRRVARRLSAVGVPGAKDYIEYLEVHPQELTALFNAILINVTSFFRDPDSWDYLRTSVVPELLRRKPTEHVRVWSAGCASGQEAYSLAIVFAEALGREEFRRRVKIYATDVDEEALSQARLGRYSERELEGLTARDIARYFEPSGENRAFQTSLRRSIIFGRNDLVQDAPISRIDVLACRNTLMYFNAEQQGRILQRMHFAIAPQGVLFLGKAEMLLSHGNLFAPIEGQRRFFHKVPQNPLRNRDFAIAGLDVDHADDMRRWGRLRSEALLSSPVPHLVSWTGTARS